MGVGLDEAEATARVRLPELVRLVAVGVGVQQRVVSGEALHAAEHPARALAQQRRHCDPRGALGCAPPQLGAVLGLDPVERALLILRLGLRLRGLCCEARGRVLDQPAGGGEAGATEAIEAETERGGGTWLEFGFGLGMRDFRD